MKKEISKVYGKDYWRSLNQLTDSKEFNKHLLSEFQEGTSDNLSTMNRRRFLGLMGASMALAGLTSCRRPVEKIVPYVTAPEQIIPGVPQYYATTMPLGTSAYGIVVESHEGRPTKIEGNEAHPSTLGRTNAIIQAAILGLYDPDRSQMVRQKGKEKEWRDFVVFWQDLYAKHQQNKGKGLAILSESFSSPTLFRLKNEFLDQFPMANWVAYEPVSDHNIREGLWVSSGKEILPLYHFERAKIIVALDADFLLTESENIIHSGGFINGRNVDSDQDIMSRLYMVESSLSVTGGMADHRIKLPASHIPAFVMALAKELQKQGLPTADVGRVENPANFIYDQQTIQIMASDLLKHKGSSLLIAGRGQSALVHAMIFALNDALMNIGTTVTYRTPKDGCFDDVHALKALINEINSGTIDTLIILAGNPIYNLPADLPLKNAIQNVSQTIHLSLYYDETSKQVEWHLPQAHFLEAWGDARATDGTLSVIQPLIAPLFAGHSTAELVHLFIKGEEASGYDVVRKTWADLLPKINFEKHWRRVLHDGLLAESQSASTLVCVKPSSLEAYIESNPIKIEQLSAENLELVFDVSPAVYDGRFANNGWLQELPDTVSKLLWDNAALMSPHTAATLGVKNEDLVVLNLQGRELPIPVWILPGQADYSVCVTLGYGRSSAGRIGNRVGFNAYRIRTSNAPFIDMGLKIRKTIETYPLANTQDHNSMEGRPLVRESDLDNFRQNAYFAREMVEHPPLISLWEEHSYTQGYQWGMAIDLNACVGCNACTIACQSENNIPIVGKEQVKNGREMHWLRVDRYFSGSVDTPEMVYQPVACQHCENAPCEQVCPVAATVHDSEGLNVMTYNRCIGTRYCSNNCPYKVRRFNFFNYTKDLPEIVHMAQNPDVTVRSRGVMEKCTYCVQRISEAKIKAKKVGKIIKEDDVVTACQQACPTNAIIFGNINDPESQVVKKKQLTRSYEMLAELNIKPRTSYLAKIRNPHPKLKDS